MEQFIKSFSELFSMDSLFISLDGLVKIILASLFGGIIGYEREHSHRPAGFRTHILVSAGSALVMMTSLYIFNKFSDVSNMDPARLGAQVISGIGFLGAGTILREGFTVKGLTTAASLWAVSCVGLAVGIGYYQGAVIATIVIYVTLNRLKKFIAKGNTGRSLYIQVVQEANNISQITDIITHNGASLQSFELIYADGEGVSSFKKQKNAVVFKAFIHYTNHEDFMAITEQIRDLEGVTDLYID